jgi:queuine tRNA-ribosyltransferase
VSNNKQHFFSIIGGNGNARVGRLITKHGTLFTPAFLFCGTQGTIKNLETWRLRELKTQILLCNTFHLLQDRNRIINGGGIHSFIGWDGPILTDSGGYQVFSLGFGSVAEEIKGTRKNRSSLVKITENDVSFRNPRNGEIVKISPEISIELQCAIGVDFVVSMDECTPYHFTYGETEKSLYRSMDWGRKSIDFFKKYKQPEQRLYGIVQGGIHKNLRDISIEFLKNNPTDCIAVGGSLGKDKEQMHDIVSYTMDNIRDHVNQEKPRPVHLLGIGDKIDIIMGVDSGIDTFDCVSVTRLSRHGTAVLSYIDNNGKDTINLKNSCYAQDLSPIEPGCPCCTCKVYSRSYINYLIKRREPIAATIICAHNIHAMNTFMHNIREAILSNNWETWKEEQKQKYYGLTNKNIT